jgi:hypothetical protein
MYGSIRASRQIWVLGAGYFKRLAWYRWYHGTWMAWRLDWPSRNLHGIEEDMNITGGTLMALDVKCRDYFSGILQYL